MRAVAAMEIDRIEEKKASVQSGVLEHKQVSAKDWETILEHDTLYEELESDEDVNGRTNNNDSD